MSENNGFVGKVRKECLYEHAFKLDGKSILSVKELYEAVRDSTERSFYDHVSLEKNDFSDWIGFCLHNDILAARVKLITDRGDFLNLISNELCKDEAYLLVSKSGNANVFSGKNASDDLIPDTLEVDDVPNYLDNPVSSKKKLSDVIPEEFFKEVDTPLKEPSTNFSEEVNDVDFEIPDFIDEPPMMKHSF